MLVLSRHQSETVVIPGLDITIQIVSIQGKTVRVGIAAPREVKILRGEVVDVDRQDSAACAKEQEVVSTDEETQPSPRPLAGYLTKAKQATSVKESAVAYRFGNRNDDAIVERTETIAC